MQKIKKRITNAKRHTTGFVLSNNKSVTRYEAIRMARKSQIEGVRIVDSRNGAYLQSTGKTSLYNLPVQVV